MASNKFRHVFMTRNDMILDKSEHVSNIMNFVNTLKYALIFINCIPRSGDFFVKLDEQMDK